MFSCNIAVIIPPMSHNGVVYAVLYLHFLLAKGTTPPGKRKSNQLYTLLLDLNNNIAAGVTRIVE